MPELNELSKIEEKDEKKSGCALLFLNYGRLQHEIDSKRRIIEDNSKRIDEKWREHNSYWPRLWSSYRTQFRQEIDSLKSENKQISKVEIPGLTKKMDEVFGEMTKCLEQQDNNQAPPVNINFTYGHK